jgi:cytidine deaminase
MNEIDLNEIVAAARHACAHAYAPCSGRYGGAALLCDDGRIATGCNVEIAANALTICAERVAIVRAVADGYRPGQFKAVAVVGDESPTICEACRLALWECCGDVPVILADMNDLKGWHRLKELMADRGTAVTG